jgi:hypothetical protein
LTDLADLCHHDKTDLFQGNEREICRLGGHIVVVQVLKKKVDDARIQEEGIRALWNFAHPTLAKMLVGDIGGVEVILTGMKRHPECETLQRVPLKIFWTKRNATLNASKNRMELHRSLPR